MIIAEDTSEGTPGVDMAATFTILGGFEWIYPGSSHNANGQTLHNIHLNSPDDPYGAARDIMQYTYGITPHLIISVNDYAAEDIFGEGLVDNIRENDWGSGMDRGPAVDAAMSDGTFQPTCNHHKHTNWKYKIPLSIKNKNFFIIFSIFLFINFF